MSAKRILVVEDDEGIRRMIVFNLSGPVSRPSRRPIVGRPRSRSPTDNGRSDPARLDAAGPERAEFARSLRREELTRDIPVIMLTARTLEDDKIRASKAESTTTSPSPLPRANDCPDSMPCCGAPRRPAVTTRSRPGLVMNMASHRVTARGKPVELGPTEYRMLKFFMTHQDRVYSRAQLLDHVWGGGVYVEERTVDVHILRLRKALASHGYDGYVQTVRGAGYVFRSLEEHAPGLAQ
jgi:two-component system, OmpR family, phosphate regulon response regulator PhoB